MFDWNDYLKLAEELGSVKNYNEACFRSGVSRAYYAIFHKAEKYANNKDAELLQKIKNENNLGSHEAIQAFLVRDSNQDIQLAGVSLGRIRKKRKECDYEDYLPDSAARIYQRVIEETKKYIVLIP